MSCTGSSSQSPSVAFSNFSCCSQSTYVQDQTCKLFDIAAPILGVNPVIFVSNFNTSRLYASGTITITTAPTDRVIEVLFLLGGPTGTIIETDTIVVGGVLTFMKTGFDTIQLTIGPGALLTPNVTGEICMNVRYPVA